MFPVFMLETLSQQLGEFGNELLGSPLLIGILIFMFIMFFSLVLMIPIEAMMVIMIPTCLLIAAWVPLLQYVCALLIGLTIGIGLLKWIKR